MAPFRLKCACKFRVVCKELTGKMHPLPNCATGEWGPTKARRHFGLEPLSHTSGLINVETVVELRLRQPRPLQYVFRLRFNDVDDSVLKRSVTVTSVKPTHLMTPLSAFRWYTSTSAFHQPQPTCSTASSA